MKTFRKLPLAALAAASALLGSAQAFAGCWLQPQGLFTRWVCADTNGPGYAYSTVKIHNACRHPIWVATNYKAMTCQDYPGNGSCLAVYVPDSDLWGDRGWWYLAPGQTSYIADTVNRYVYFYAETDRSAPRSLVWRGSAYRGNLRGRTLDYFLTDLGGRMTNFTQTFTCPGGYAADGTPTEEPVSSVNFDTGTPSGGGVARDGDDGWDGGASGGGDGGWN